METDEVYAIVSYMSQMDGLNRDLEKMCKDLDGVLEGIEEFDEDRTLLCFQFSDETAGDMFCRRVMDLFIGLELRGTVVLTDDPDFLLEDDDEDDADGGAA